jgi:hypothetical protein
MLAVCPQRHDRKARAGSAAASVPDAPAITSPADDAVVPGDVVTIVASAAADEVGVTIGVWRSQTGDTADAVEVVGYTGITGGDGTATIADVPKA